jgi:hypothetical protein
VLSLGRYGDGLRPCLVRITYAAVGICALLGGLSCPPQQTLQPREQVPESDITLFFSGDELGALKPCGCSGGQLGGLERRPAIFGVVPTDKRMLVETGSLVSGEGTQDMLKFRIFMEAFGSIGYDVVNLSARDVVVSDRLGLSQGNDNRFKAIVAQGPSPSGDRLSSISKEFAVKGQNVSVIVGSADAKVDQVDKALSFWAAKSGRTVKVLLLQNAADNVLDDWVAKSGADCIVCPSTTDDPQVLSPPKTRPLVFAIGRFGRHITRVDVTVPPADEPFAMRLRDIRVEEKLAQDTALVNLYKQYQVLVRDSRLLESHPRVPLPNYLQYVGTAKCEACHIYEHTMWSSQRHAQAFATLQKVGSDADPECVVCHVVGFEREGGFTVPEKTPHLENVACEVCHGPGSEHIRSGGHVPTSEPKIACLQCHTPEHSGGYAGHEAEYRKKIEHWLEP